MILNSADEVPSITFITGAPRSPIEASATPNSTATNSTCSTCASVNALTSVLGMIAMM